MWSVELTTVTERVINWRHRRCIGGIIIALSAAACLFILGSILTTPPLLREADIYTIAVSIFIFKIFDTTIQLYLYMTFTKRCINKL